MKLSFLGLSAAVVVGASTLAASAQGPPPPPPPADTYTAGAALVVLDPLTGLPSAAEGDNAVIAAGAVTIPGATPVVNGGPSALINVALGTASDLNVNVAMSQVDDFVTIVATWSTWSGSAFSTLYAGGSTLPSGNEANAIAFDIGNQTGAGAPLFPIDGVNIGTEFSYLGGTMALYNAGGVFSDTPFAPIDTGFPTDPTQYYLTTGFDFGTLAATGMNKAVYTITLQVVPAPGALALLGLAGLAGRRRRR